MSHLKDRKWTSLLNDLVLEIECTKKGKSIKHNEILGSVHRMWKCVGDGYVPISNYWCNFKLIEIIWGAFRALVPKHVADGRSSSLNSSSACCFVAAMRYAVDAKYRNEGVDRALNLFGKCLGTSCDVFILTLFNLLSLSCSADKLNEDW
jgi:hypothetical protein